MLCKRNCNRLFLYPVIIWAYLELFCEVSANISSMNKSLQPWRLKCFNLSTMKFKKKNVCVPTCPHLYFCCCCHWCLLVLHNIFEYDKRYIIIIYHQVCSFCIYIQWLPFAKEKKDHLSQCYIRIIYLFVPSAGSYNRSRTWLLYVMIYLTEQCNRRTVHYSLVGKRSMLCAPGLWGTLTVIMVLSVFPTLLFL